MASVANWQVIKALVKQSSRGWGLLGVVVVAEPEVVAVISPQFVVAGAAVGVFVGTCAGVFVATGCEDGVAVAATDVGAVSVTVAVAVTVAVGRSGVFVPATVVALHPESMRAVRIPTDSSVEMRHMSLPSKAKNKREQKPFR